MYNYNTHYEIIIGCRACSFSDTAVTDADCPIMNASDNGRN